MLNRLLNVAAPAVVFLLVSAPAFAGLPPPRTTGIPEPASLTLFGAGVGGAYLVRKFIRRK